MESKIGERKSLPAAQIQTPLKSFRGGDSFRSLPNPATDHIDTLSAELSEQIHSLQKSYASLLTLVHVSPGDKAGGMIGRSCGNEQVQIKHGAKIEKANTKLQPHDNGRPLHNSQRNECVTEIKSVKEVVKSTPETPNYSTHESSCQTTPERRLIQEKMDELMKAMNELRTKVEANEKMHSEIHKELLKERSASQALTRILEVVVSHSNSVLQTTMDESSIMSILNESYEFNHVPVGDKKKDMEINGSTPEYDLQKDEKATEFHLIEPPHSSSRNLYPIQEEPECFEHTLHQNGDYDGTEQRMVVSTPRNHSSSVPKARGLLEGSRIEIVRNESPITHASKSNSPTRMSLYRTPSSPNLKPFVPIQESPSPVASPLKSPAVEKKDPPGSKAKSNGTQIASKSIKKVSTKQNQLEEQQISSRTERSVSRADEKTRRGSRLFTGQSEQVEFSDGSHFGNYERCSCHEKAATGGVWSRSAGCFCKEMKVACGDCKSDFPVPKPYANVTVARRANFFHKNNCNCWCHIHWSCCGDNEKESSQCRKHQSNRK